VTVQQQTPYNTYTGNGVTTVFPYQFKILAAADLAVYVSGALKTLNADYTVSGVGINAGGSVTFISGAPAAAASVSLLRAMKRQRLTDYQLAGDFNTPTVNPDFDNPVLLIQDMAVQLQRAITLPIDEVGTLPTLPSKAARSGKFITFDAAGQPTASVGTGNDTALRTDLATTTIGSDGARLVGFRRAEAGAVAITVSAILAGFVLAEMFGAVGDGVSDDASAIQSALNTGKPVQLLQKKYAIGATLRLKFCGQRLLGSGMGDNNAAGSFAPRTTIKWIGAAAGKMLSVSDGATANFSEIEIRDLALDGNALANIGIEAYDDTVAGGCWRNRWTNVAIVGVTNGVNPTGIYTGAGPFPNFSHDTVSRGLFVYNCNYGMRGAGARHSIANSTFQLCSVAAIRGESGSAWTTKNSIFVQNGRDFDGDTIQVYSDYGSWFENSVNGIYRASTAHAAYFMGSFLHTANATRLMDMGNAAGNFVVKGFVNGTSASLLIQNVNGNYEYDVTGTNCTIAPGYRLRTQGSLRADQSAFAAGLTADQANATGDATAVNLATYTENFDLSNVFDAVTGIFTAPLFGYYEFTGHIQLANLIAGHNDALLILVTTGQSYLLDRVNPGAVKIGANEAHMTGRVVVPMNSGDTAKLQVIVSGSTKTVTLSSGGAASNWRTRFEGRMT
jgi:hypothetical protein